MSGALQAIAHLEPQTTNDTFIERFNRIYRTEILVFYLFRTLNEASEIKYLFISALY
ncbi:hypothetical protein GO007_21615 [Raoultella sp. 10-1]|nr:hypothetical protein [Raoultella sp. 10-1]